MTDQATPDNGNLRFILIDSYSENFDRPGGISSGRSTPVENGNCRFILINSYSESPGRPGGRSSARSTHPEMAISDHTDRFLLWELRQTTWQIKWPISPPENGNMRFILIDSYSDSSGRTCHRLPPPENGNLRFILIDSYSENSGRWSCRSSGRSIPLENGNFRFILIDSYSESSCRQGGRSTSRKWQCEIHTDIFLLWELRQTSWQIKWQI